MLILAKVKTFKKMRHKRGMDDGAANNMSKNIKNQIWDQRMVAQDGGVAQDWHCMLETLKPQLYPRF